MATCTPVLRSIAELRRQRPSSGQWLAVTNLPKPLVNVVNSHKTPSDLGKSDSLSS